MRHLSQFAKGGAAMPAPPSRIRQLVTAVGDMLTGVPRQHAYSQIGGREVLRHRPDYANWALDTVKDDRITAGDNAVSSLRSLFGNMLGGAGLGAGAETLHEPEHRNFAAGAGVGALAGMGRYGARLLGRRGAFTGAIPAVDQSVGVLGAAGAYQAGNALRNEPSTPALPIKKADFINSVRRQLPRAVGQDLMIGGGLGTAYHVAAEGMPSQDAPPDYYGRLAGRALFGAAGTNVALDRARRYLGHNFMPFNYTGGAQLGNKPVLSRLKDFWNGAVLDRPTPEMLLNPHTGEKFLSKNPTFDKLRMTGKVDGHGIFGVDSPAESAHAYGSRSELWKRYLGTHHEDKAKDYFVRSGPNGRVEYNPRTMAPGTEANQGLLLSPTGMKDLAIRPDAIDKEYRYNTEGGVAPLKNTWGGHDFARSDARTLGNVDELPDIPFQGATVKGQELVPGLRAAGQLPVQRDLRLRDAWDFRVDPAERRELVSYLGELGRRPGKALDIMLSPAARAADRNIASPDSGHRVFHRFTEFAKRHILENVLRHESPIINQDIRYTHLPSRLGQQLTDPRVVRPEMMDAGLRAQMQSVLQRDPHAMLPFRAEAISGGKELGPESGAAKLLTPALAAGGAASQTSAFSPLASAFASAKRPVLLLDPKPAPSQPQTAQGSTPYSVDIPALYEKFKAMVQPVAKDLTRRFSF